MLTCQEPNCTNEGTPCFYPDNDTETPDCYYCTEHAYSQGFCYLCGLFWSCVNTFEFPTIYGIVPGLCENCSDDIKTELGEDEDEDDCYVFEIP